jgi:Family of unknown function (DUF6364)
MAKLTLSVDDQVIARAKQFAKLHGSSISKMVETYLFEVSEPPSRSAKGAPILRSLRGIIKNADIEDYRKHLATKYR